MATNDVIRQFIVSMILTEGSRCELKDTDSLLEEGIIDSFGIMALLSFLEDNFSIQIQGDELLPENFETIVAISSLVERVHGQQLEV